MVILSTILLPLHPLLAEEPKVAFSRGAKIEVMISKPARTKGGDYDDQMQEIKPRLKMTNTDAAQNYEGYKGSFIIIGQSAADRKAFSALTRHDFDFSLMARKTHDEKLESLTTRYDKTGMVFGYKYDGWILLIKDPSGKIVLTKATSSTHEKLPEKADTLTKNSVFDRFLDKSDIEITR